MNIKTTVPFVVQGQTFKAELSPDDGKMSGIARAYVPDVQDIDAAAILAPFAQAVGAKTAYTVRGEFPALDKAWDAINGHIVAQKTEVLNAALKLLCDDADAVIETAKFSRKAGCACGCSPGFKVPGLPRRTNLFISKV